MIGLAALHPQQILVNGEPLVVAVAGDFAVEASRRGFGPAVALQRTLLPLLETRGWDLAYGLPNDAANSVMRRVGYRELGHFQGFSRRLTRSERLGAAVGAGSLARALRGHDTERPEQFDDRFDEIWEAMSLRASYLPAGGAQLMNWRYELAGEGPRRFSVTTVTSGTTVRGYSVATVAYGVRQVLELAWLDEAGLRAVVAAELTRAARERLGGVDFLYLGRPDQLEPVLTPLGFVATPAPAVILYLPGEAGPRIEDADSWLLFEGSTDI